MVLETCYPGDSYSESFFATTLNIKDSTLKTVLDELLKWTREDPGSHDISETRRAYEYLDSNTRTDEDLKTVR